MEPSLVALSGRLSKLASRRFVPPLDFYTSRALFFIHGLGRGIQLGWLEQEGNNDSA